MRKPNRWSVYGAVSLSAALLLTGCTGGADTPENPSAGTSGSYESMWIELGETPGKWLDVEKTSGSLSDKQLAKFVTNFDGNCSYHFATEKLGHSTEGGTERASKYLEEVSKKSEFENYDVANDQDKTSVASVTYEDKKDHDGDGNKGKTTVLYHVFDEQNPDIKDSSVRLVYSCQNAKDWDENELKSLLDVTKIHMTENS